MLASSVKVLTFSIVVVVLQNSSVSTQPKREQRIAASFSQSWLWE
jgi:hypothetical protein